MPRPRFEKLDVAKKAAILNAALEAFAAHGFEGASYNQIIEQAGVSKGAMYYYFDDKEDLFATVARRELADIWEQFKTIPDVKTVKEFWIMMEGLMDRFAEFALQRPLTMGLMRGVLRMKKEGIKNPIIQEIHDLGTSFTGSFLERGQEIGAVRTDVPLPVLEALLTAVDEVADMQIVESVESMEELTPEVMQRWGAFYVDIIHRIIAPSVIFSEEGA